MYEASTDRVVALGTLEYCAKACTCSVDTLVQAMSKYNNGLLNSVKYELYVLDDVINGKYIEEEDDFE